MESNSQTILSLSLQHLIECKSRHCFQILFVPMVKIYNQYRASFSAAPISIFLENPMKAE